MVVATSEGERVDREVIRGEPPGRPGSPRLRRRRILTPARLLLVALFAAGCGVLAGPVIDPTGAAYTGVSASDQYNASYSPQQLFTHDVTGLAPGAAVESAPGVDWAIHGTGPGYVAFQLDQVYEVGSLFCAQSIASRGFGDDPANWQAAAPTAGRLNVGAFTADTDHDGLPDEWELAHGLDPRDPFGVNGPLGDPDGDGLDNLREFLAGTDPQDAASRLKIDTIVAAAGGALTFQAMAGHSYTVQFAGAPVASAWQRLVDLPARPTNHLESVTGIAAVTNRFYRLTTPQLP